MLPDYQARKGWLRDNGAGLDLWRCEAKCHSTTPSQARCKFFKGAMEQSAW